MKAATTYWLLGTAGALAVLLTVYELYLQRITALHAALLILLIPVFVVLFGLFLEKTIEGNRLEVESHWGGLGGGLGGWRVSTPLTLLVVSTGILALIVATVSAQPPSCPDLRERYRGAFNVVAQKISFSRREMVGCKLYVTGTAASAQDINRFWDQVKLADATYDDIVVNLAIKPAAAAAGRTDAP